MCFGVNVYIQLQYFINHTRCRTVAADLYVCGLLPVVTRFKLIRCIIQFNSLWEVHTQTPVWLNKYLATTVVATVIILCVCVDTVVVY